MSKVFNRDVRLTGGAALYVNEVLVVDGSGNIDAPVTTTNLTASGNTTIGDSSSDNLTVNAKITSGMVSNTAETGGSSKKIKITIDGVVHYINAYTG